MICLGVHNSVTGTHFLFCLDEALCGSRKHLSNHIYNTHVQGKCCPCQRSLPRLWPLGPATVFPSLSAKLFDGAPTCRSAEYLHGAQAGGFLSLCRRHLKVRTFVAMLSFMGLLYLLRLQCVPDRDHQIWCSRSGSGPCVGIAAASLGRRSLRFCDRSWCCV